MASQAAELARRLAPRCRGGVPPLPLQWSPPRPLLAGRRRHQHTGPQPVRPAHWSGERQRRRRQMDRCRHRRARRLARSHCAQHGASIAYGTCSTKPARFSVCHASDRHPIAAHRGHRLRSDRRNPRAVCSRCRVRFRAPSQKPICATAALRLSTRPRHCASTRAATIGPMTMRRPKSGRR